MSIFFYKKRDGNIATEKDSTDSIIKIFFRFADGDDDDGAVSVAASKSSKHIPVLDKLGDEEGNINIGSVTNAVKGKVGNLLGKGIGGIGMGGLNKLGGSWF